MSRIDTQALRALRLAGTAGEWRAGRSDMVSYHGDGGGPFKAVYCGYDGEHLGEPLPREIARAEGGDSVVADATLIAGAVNSLAAVCDELDAARAQLRQAREAIKWLDDEDGLPCSNASAELPEGQCGCAACAVRRFGSEVGS